MIDFKTRREALDLSQIDLANLAGVSVATVRLFDQGYNPKDSATRERIAAALDRQESKVAKA